MIKNKDELITLHKLYTDHTGKRKAIHWIDSFPTLRKWVVRDLETNNFLGTKIIESEGRTGKRYYIPKGNIDNFVRAFNDGSLYAKIEKEKSGS